MSAPAPRRPDDSAVVSPAFRDVAFGMLELHRLELRGENDSVEADAIRDRLDRPYANLTAAEQDRARWLSADLYSISDPPPDAPGPMTAEAQAGFYEAAEAFERGAWDEALAALRRWRESIDPAVLAGRRGAIWAEAGVPEVAAEFHRHAASLRPEAAAPAARYRSVLAAADPDAADAFAQPAEGAEPPARVVSG